MRQLEAKSIARPQHITPVAAVTCALALGLGAGPAGPVAAHAADQGFVLLLPTDVYITAAVSAFVLTVVLIALLPAGASAAMFRARNIIRGAGPGWVPMVTSLLAFAIYGALIAVGINGPRDPLSNLAPLVIWSLWWIGFVALHALVGDLWRWVNPWTGPYRVIFGDRVEGILTLPQWVGVWPAMGGFLMFTSFSIVDAAPMDPDRLARMALWYWVYTFAGMAVFGGPDWLRRCEGFTVFFDILSRIAPVRLASGVRAGMPGWSVLEARGGSLSAAVFCLMILGTGSFDGLNETFWWLVQIGVNPLEFQGRSTITRETIIGFSGSNLLLLLVFALCVWLGARLAGPTGPGFQALFARLALSLVPIGLGFHIAHFLTSFLVTAQYARAALTDPWATGANWLGLESTRVLVGFLADAETVKVIWFTQAFVVVMSHVFAVLIAHGITRQVYADRRAAQRAELPLSVFMVLYTLFGLWLLSAARGA